jgi:hypothetical protein
VRTRLCLSASRLHLSSCHFCHFLALYCFIFPFQLLLLFLLLPLFFSSIYHRHKHNSPSQSLHVPPPSGLIAFLSSRLHTRYSDPPPTHIHSLLDLFKIQPCNTQVLLLEATYFECTCLSLQGPLLLESVPAAPLLTI